jgi:hypothetical protein
MNALYQEDESKVIRESHKNPSIEAIYRDFWWSPVGRCRIIYYIRIML